MKLILTAILTAKTETRLDHGHENQTEIIAKCRIIDENK